MTTLIKHPLHGNKHASAAEAEALTREGWVIWPRSKQAKAGIVPPELIPLKVVEQPVKRGPGRPRKGA